MVNDDLNHYRDFKADGQAIALPVNYMQHHG